MYCVSLCTCLMSRLWSLDEQRLMLPRWAPPGIALVLHWNAASLYSPLLYSPPLPSIPSPHPQPSVRGETRTADIQTTQQEYSSAASCRTVMDTSSAPAFVLGDKRVEISVIEHVGDKLIWRESEYICRNTTIRSHRGQHFNNQV